MEGLSAADHLINQYLGPIGLAPTISKGFVYDGGAQTDPQNRLYLTHYMLQALCLINREQ